VSADEPVTATAVSPGPLPVEPTGGSLPGPGDLLGGRFLIRELLGAGGAGAVFSALDSAVGRRVAVKVLRPELRDDASRERMRREARATASGHPNVVTVHDLHESDGHLYLSMELVAGRSLSALLTERTTLPVEEVVDLGRQVAAALEHLHAAGLVHRDLKPGNLLISEGGAVKLCDLGLSRPVARGVTVTETAMVVGTPAYMAPEQARAGKPTSATDVYALGLVLYRCLTGIVPLEGSTAVETLMRRQKQRVAPLQHLAPGCPRWLETLLRWMLEPAPGDRPTAIQVRRALTERRASGRPLRPALRRAAVPVVAVCALAALGGLALRSRLAGGDAASWPRLVHTVRQFEGGTAFDLLDDTGHTLRTFHTTANWTDQSHRQLGSSAVAFGDVDGDGLQEVLYADPAAGGELEIWTRTGARTLEPLRTIALGGAYTYGGTLHADFRLADLACSDLDGNGADEVVLLTRSFPYYPGRLQVLDGDGGVRATVWHPGHLNTVVSGDRDRDGRPELYAAGTCNFVADSPGSESTPVLLAVGADWPRRGLELDLFGPDRTLPARVAEPFGVVYASFGKVRLPGYLQPWESAAGPQLQQQDAGGWFLQVTASQLSLEVDNGRRLTMLRAFYLDRGLRLLDAMWQTQALVTLGHDPSDPALEEFLTVRYWNGGGWQDEPCEVPTS